MTVTINQPLQYTLAANDSTVCTGTTVTLSVNIQPIDTVMDIQGNIYQTVRIGTQTWMAENLRFSSYTTNVVANNQWSTLSSAAWSYYNNDSQYNSTYGKLYNWYAANDYLICPYGWHLPNDAEWTILVNNLGGPAIAGSKMKNTGTQFWVSPNLDATNSSGFNGLPSGARGEDGSFSDLTFSGYFWSASQINSTNASYWFLDYAGGDVFNPAVNKKTGKAIRCIKD